MKNKLRMLLMVFGLVFGLSLLLPAQDLKAATVSRAEAQRDLQIRFTPDRTHVTPDRTHVTVDWKNFTTNNYILTINSLNGTNHRDFTITNTGDSVFHRSYSISALSSATVYQIRITDSVDHSQSILMGFFVGDGDGIATASYDTTKNRLSWTDTCTRKDTASYQYQLRFYPNEAASENPSSLVRYAGQGATYKDFTTQTCDSGCYWVTVQPLYKIDGVAYYGADRSLECRVVFKPENVKVTAEPGSATITWSPVKGATSYVVKDITSSPYKTLGTVSNCSYKVNNLTAGKTYKFCVYTKCAVSTAEGPHTLTSVKSATVSVTTPKITNGKVSNLQVYGLNGKIYVDWNGVSGCNGYIVYYKKSGASSYSTLGTTSSTTLTTTKLNSSNQAYVFMVKPYTLYNGKKYASTAAAPTVTANPYKLLNAMSTVRTIGYLSKTTTTTKLYNSYTSSTAVLTVGSGKNIEQLEAENTKYGRCKVLYNNKTYYCKRSNIKSYGANYTTKKYPTSVKEAFVKNKSSKTKYLIWVSHYTQQVSIFQGAKGNWKMIRTFICATGKHTTRSARGTFKITYKEAAWKYSTTYENYITHFFGRNSFHTRIHKYGGGYADATIGKPASNGCVRLYDEDALYIYKNMPKDTTVIAY